MSPQFWSRREGHRVLVENPSTLYDFPKGV
jgi:hypothetical protein